MLYASLVLSVILLLAACCAARLSGYLAAGIFGLGGVLAWLLGSAGVFFPPVALQIIFLCVAVPVWRTRSSSRLSLLAVSSLATVAAYGVALYLCLTGDQREYARLRERFPYQSMEARLPVPHSPAVGVQLSGHTEEELSLLEDTIPKKSERNYILSRAFLLRRLHEEKVNLFVNSSGFGVARMLGLPSERGLRYNLRSNGPVPQPASPPSRPTGDPSPLPVVSNDAGLSRLHRSGVVDFVHPFGFGYVKDRRHVAGFQSHRFSRVPGPEARWHVRRLELVGLLLRDQPVVYVSESLPSMDQLRGAPARPLDRFEASALEKLRRGEYLVVADAPGGLRMLGAIRSVRQCVQCHGGERGDLLGAFSYTLSNINVGRIQGVQLRRRAQF